MTRKSPPRRPKRQTAADRSSHSLDAALIGVLILLCFFNFYESFASRLELSDEGFLAYGAVRVLQGEVPNRDFVSLQPPLSFYTVAGVFKLLGTSLHSLRVMGFALHLLIVALTYLICRSFARPLTALTAALPSVLIGIPFFNFVPFAVWQGIVFSLASIWFFLTYLSRQELYLLFLCGTANALALLSRHDQGFYMAFSIALCLVTLFLTRRLANRLLLLRAILYWIGGVLLLIAPFAVWSVYSGSARDVMQQLVLFPFTTYGKTSSVPMPRFDWSRDLSQNVFTSFYYLTPLIAFATLLACIIRRLRNRAVDFPVRGFFLSMVALLFYLQVLTRSDLNHLIITAPPFFILLGFILWTTIQCAARALRLKMRSMAEDAEIIATGVLCAAFAVVLFAGFSCYKDKLVNAAPDNFTNLSLPRGGVLVDENLRNSLETLVSIIQNNTDRHQPILCLPYQPMIYFLAERDNPTRWNYLWPGDQSENDHRMLIEEAKQKNTGLVLLFGKEKLNGYAPSIVKYIESSFDLVAEGNGTALYVQPGKKVKT